MSESIRKARYDKRRDAVLKAAVKEINQRGVRGMTMSLVAGHLNLAPPAVVYYFKTKDDLAAAVFLSAIERYSALIDDVGQAPRSDERLRAFISAFVELHHLIAVGRAEPIANFNDVRALNDPRVNEAYVGMFRKVRQLAPEVPGLNKNDTNARAHLLLSQLLWSTAWLKWFDPRDYPRLALRLGDILLFGLTLSSRSTPASHALPPPINAAADLGPSELFLRAATQLINEQGYHGASVERISSRLNLSKGAFYHHNETKDELVVACFQRNFDLIWSAIDNGVKESGTALQALGSICDSLVAYQFSGDAPLLSTTAFSTVPEAIRSHLMQSLDHIGRRLASILSDGIADGSIRAVDTNVAAQVITGAINAAADLKFWIRPDAQGLVDVDYGALIFMGINAAAKVG